jgi:hypothetical protein
MVSSLRVLPGGDRLRSFMGVLTGLVGLRGELVGQGGHAGRQLAQLASTLAFRFTGVRLLGSPGTPAEAP